MQIRYTFDRDEASEWIRGLRGDVIGFDIETYGRNGLDPYQSATRLAQFYDGGDTSYVVDIAHTGMLPEIEALLTDASRTKLIHNAAFETKHWKKQYNIDIQNRYCTMVAHQVLFAGKTTYGNKLKDVIYYYYGFQVDKELQGSDWGGVLTEEQIQYAGYDPILNMLAYKCQMAMLQSLPDADRQSTLKVLKLEMDLVPLIAQMELQGLYYDFRRLTQLEPVFREEMESQLNQARATLPPLDLRLMRPEPGKSNKWWTATGNLTKLHREKYPQSVKPPETPQEFMTLFKQCGVEIPKKQKTGKESLSADTYGKLNHPSGKFLQQWASAKTIYNTFVKGALTKDGHGWANPVTGKAHPGINQTGTVTGRMSMSNPNFQNIPRKETRFRPLLYAPEGWSIVKADYSQMELRVMAQVSQDENLIKAYIEGRDVHAMTAAKIYNRQVEDYMNSQYKGERNTAKSVNFGSLYGQQAKGLQQYLFKEVGLDLSEEVCQHFLNSFFEVYPGIRKYHEMTKKSVIEVASKTAGKYSMATLFGRIRYWEDLKVHAHHKRGGTTGTSYSVRMNDILNLPVQGTAGDIIKLVMLKLYQEVLNECIQLLLQVHDELVFLVRDDYIENFVKILRYVMITEAQNILVDVPVEVDINVGWNWAGEKKAA